MYSAHRSNSGLLRNVGLLIAGLVLAAGTASPGTRDGLFVSGTCEAPVNFIVNVGQIQLFSDESVTFLTNVTEGPRDQETGWQEITDTGFKYYVRMPTPDTLDWAYLTKGEEPGVDRGAPAAKDDLDLSLWTLESLVRCQSLNGELRAIHGEASAMLLDMIPVFAACDQQAPNCPGLLFGLADISPDGGLTRAELSRIIRILAYFGAASQEVAEPSDTIGASLATIPFAPLLASAILGSYDYDDDGKASLEELGRDRLDPDLLSASLTGQNASALQSLIENTSSTIKQLLPFLMQKL
jgi:hypothetical protein